ncbi:LicD family protein [Enterococcus hulanensis]|uniref:LicD family protein n=1 Tax=Enterococcus hulanensis TaxID=2559929 RepID=UPI0010F84E7A|nr:LicD family protein [Enterococcus hulanensis]
MKKDNQLRELQLLELEALTELRNFCKKNGMDFFLRGGSVMGAVKYKGFVPWDDDADIAILRKDYMRLIELTSKIDWSEKFYILSYKSNPEIHCYFPRVLLKEDERKSRGFPKNNKLGLTVIDILPIDGTPNNVIKRYIYYFLTYLYRALAGVWTMDVEDTVNMHSSKKRMILRFLKMTGISRLYTQVGMYNKLDKLYTKYSIEKSHYIGTITGSLYRKEILLKEFWGNGLEVKFENQKFLIPSHYDEYLKQLYGDNYLTYTPSVEEQYSKKHIK